MYKAKHLKVENTCQVHKNKKKKTGKEQTLKQIENGSKARRGMQRAHQLKLPHPYPNMFSPKINVQICYQDKICLCMLTNKTCNNKYKYHSRVCHKARPYKKKVFLVSPLKTRHLTQFWWGEINLCFYPQKLKAISGRARKKLRQLYIFSHLDIRA